MVVSAAPAANGDRRGAAQADLGSVIVIVAAHWLILIAGVRWLLPGCWARPHSVVLLVSGLSAAAVALVVLSGSRSSPVRWMIWPILALVVTSWLCAQLAPLDTRPALTALVELGLACTFSAAGVRLATRGAPRRSGPSSLRSIGATLVGGLGLLAVILVTRRGPPGASFPALITVPTLVALGSGALRLDVAVRQGSVDDATRISKQLLAALWFGIAALAASSLAAAGSLLCTLSPVRFPGAQAWPMAVAGARLGWLNVLPLMGSVIVIFAGRLELAGRAILATRERWGVLALLSVAGIAAGAHGISEAGRGGAAAAARAPAAPSITATGSALAPSPSLTPPTPAALSASSLRDAAGPAPEPSVPEAAPSVDVSDTAAPVRIETLSVLNMEESDVRQAIEGRLELLGSCRTRLEEQRAGTVRFKVLLSETGGVSSVLPRGGELDGTQLARCMMLTFYRMGFPAPGPDRGSFVVSFAVSATP